MNKGSLCLCSTYNPSSKTDDKRVGQLEHSGSSPSILSPAKADGKGTSGGGKAAVAPITSMPAGSEQQPSRAGSAGISCSKKAAAGIEGATGLTAAISHAQQAYGGLTAVIQGCRGHEQ